MVHIESPWQVHELEQDMPSVHEQISAMKEQAEEERAPASERLRTPRRPRRPQASSESSLLAPLQMRPSHLPLASPKALHP